MFIRKGNDFAYGIDHYIFMDGKFFSLLGSDTIFNRIYSVLDNKAKLYVYCKKG